MKLSTGVRVIDRTFDGGLPPGSMVVLTSPPDAQVDPLLNAGVHVRPTLYFTTIRTETAVRDELDRLLADPKLELLRNVGVDGALVDILGGMEQLDGGEDVVVDVLDPLETSVDQSTYVQFLNDFTDRLQATDSVAVVHCLDTEKTPDNRKLTLSTADFVWRLRRRRERNKLSYELEIPKASGMTLEDDDRCLDLNLGQSVSIDTSRDIA